MSRNTFFRILNALFCLGFTAFALSQFALLIQPLLAVPYDWKLELAFVLGQLVFQFPFIYHKSMDVKIVYYENMLTVSLIGSLLLMPVIITNHFYTLTAVINLSYFAMVVVILFFEHLRRVHRLALPTYLCFSWIVYRLLILTCIL